MKCEDKEILTRLLAQTMAHMKLVQSIIEKNELPDIIAGSCLYGLGLVDAVCVINEDFKQYREVAVSPEDNDCQAFAAAARALYDWMQKNELVLAPAE